jgi:cytochrome b
MADGSVHSGAVWDLFIRVAGVALLAVLALAYATGEEYPHTHMLIGYAIAILIVANLLWLIVSMRDSRRIRSSYSLGTIKTLFQNADSSTKTISTSIAILMAVPLFALLIIVITHTIWGTTRIDEMHEVVAYFAVGLVALYAVLVGIASSRFVEGYLRGLFERGKHS